jgi:PAS domain-containing protein
VSCRKAHACCEDTRPCSRCISHGLQCVDVQGKKRGRKKKSKDEEDEMEEKEKKPMKKRQIKKKTDSQPSKRKKKSDNSSPNEVNQTTVATPPPQQVVQPITTQPVSLNQQPVANGISTNINPITLSTMPQQQQQQQQRTLPPSHVAGSFDASLFSNQPPEIQQLASILMNSHDTFYLHNSNLNVSDIGSDNLFGTPPPFEEYAFSPSRDGATSSTDSVDRNIPSPGSFFDDGGGLFGSLSPVNFLFAPLTQDQNSPLGPTTPTPSTSNNTTTSIQQPQPQQQQTVPPVQQQQPQQPLKAETTAPPPVAPVQNNSPVNTTLTYSSPSPSSTSMPWTIPEHSNNTNAVAPANNSVNNMSLEQQMKTTEAIMNGVEPDIRKIVEDSVRTLERADMRADNRSPDKRSDELTFMEYLHKNFASSLMLQNSQLQQQNTKEKEETQQQEVHYSSKDEEIEALRRQVQQYRQESGRKSNAVALLTALNESMRSQLDEFILAKRALPSSSGTSSEVTTPTFADIASRGKSLQKSYQELCQLMQNKQEMDSSTFGIMLCFPGGRIISLNKTLLDKLGYGPEDLFDRLERWEDIIHQNSYSIVVGQLSKLLKSPPAPRKSFKVKVGCRPKFGNQPVMSDLYTCLVGGKNSVPVFCISYFLFPE